MPTTIDPYEPVLTIGAVAQQLGIAVQTVRMYAEEGLVLPHKSRGGRRMFSLHDLDRLRTVRRMIADYGLSIRGTKQLLAMIPCWEYRGGFDDDCRRCPVYTENVGPCWSVKDVGHKCLYEDCRDCAVYRLPLDFDQLKQTIHGPARSRQPAASWSEGRRK